MKLRIRCPATKETFRLDVSPSASLADLQALVADRVAHAAPPPSAAVRFSLNRRDELAPSSPHETLLSLGLASGDLLFYTLDPSGFSPSSSTAPPAPAPPAGEGSVSSAKSAEETLTLAPPVRAGGECGDPVVEQTGDYLAAGGGLQEEVVAGNALEGEAAVHDVMEVGAGGASNSVPSFLKRVLEGEGVDEKARSGLGALVIAVHAVLLETGFLAHGCEGTRMPEGWASRASTVSISYTIPELANPNFRAVVETVELKILLVGKFADVYGCLRGSSDLHRLCLDASKFVPSVASCMESLSEEDEKVVFELWKTVKDRLSLPLLMDICEKNGLPPPPCFTCLPTELKTRTLELVSGADLARIACVNSEFRYLASNDDLWKQKFVEEFPSREMDARRGVPGRRWKDKFAACWMGRKRNKRHRVVSISTIVPLGVPPLLRRDPARFGVPMPHVIGGDFDRFPVMGLARPSRSRQARPPFLQGQSFIPHCSLGGFNA